MIAIVGAGPSGIGVLERLGANAPELLAGRDLEVHLIDPYPAGPGRIWRRDQSPLLMLNTMSAHVTMFTDDSVLCDGPIRPGPSLLDWIGRHGTEAERQTITRTSFPTRRLQSRYLTWVYEQAVAALPAGSTFRFHQVRAVELTEEPGGRQRVSMADGRELTADVVVLAVGHQDVEVAGEHGRLAEFAARHDLVFLPPGYAADCDLSVVPAGEPVIVRGLGLAFMDLAVLLTEGRGGRFVETGSGLRYEPGGQEPLLYAGSRRGVPYPPKLTFPLSGPPPALPRFFDAARIVAEARGPLDFRRDVWPAIAAEVGWGYYHELVTGHPDRVTVGLDEFAPAYAAAVHDPDRMRRLLADTVVDPADLFDIGRLDTPLLGERFADPADLQARIRDYLVSTVDRSENPRNSPYLGATFGLLSAFTALPRLVADGRFTARSRAVDVDGWWAGLVNLVANGPPPRRARELLALSEAGVVRFVGPDMWVEAREGRFAAGSPAVPGTVTARAFVESRLPVGSAPASRDPLVRTLYERGQLSEDVAADGEFRHRTGLAAVDGQDGAVFDAVGRRHARRFAIGPFTVAIAGGNFTRPGANALPSRITDAVARSALRAAVSAE